MIPFRTQVKFFLENRERVDLAQFAAIFQRWIQQNALKELLIDVADYRHVFEGPGVVLIGHASDYSVESRNGRIGLLYTRKRQLEPDLPAQLRTSLQFALAAGELLEAETAFDPKLKFRGDEIEIRFADRLQLPNRPETFDLIKDDLERVFTELYGSSTVQFAPARRDPRDMFTIEVRREGAVDLRDWSRQFQANAQG